MANVNSLLNNNIYNIEILLQRKENEKHIEGYKKDRQFRISENESQQQYYFEQIISLTEKINKLRSICRENTKGN